MTHPLPDFPPLFPSQEWWRLYICSLLGDVGKDGAMAGSNRKSGVRPRAWMRFAIERAELSMPVCGGANTLKNYPSASWRLAAQAPREAGKAAATLATVYGRRPFFQPLADAFSIPAEEGASCRDVCLLAFSNIENILGLDDPALLTNINEKLETGDKTLRQIRTEFATCFKPELSIIDLLASLGPDAIFALLPPF